MESWGRKGGRGHVLGFGSATRETSASGWSVPGAHLHKAPWARVHQMGPIWALCVRRGEHSQLAVRCAGTAV